MSNTGIITHIFEVDLYTTTSYPVVKAQQYDNATRYLQVVLKDHEEHYTIPSGATLQLFGTRPEAGNPQHREFLITGTPVQGTDDTVLFDITQAIDRAGIAVAQVRILSGSTILRSIPIHFDITEAAASGASITEAEKDVLDVLTQEINNHITDNVAHLTQAEHERFTALRNIIYSANEPTTQDSDDIWLQEYN